MNAIPNPEYFESEHYPCTGHLNGYLIFDRTQPRLSDEAYLKQCEQLGITPHAVLEANILAGLAALAKMENQP